jgi:glutathione S-transferase
MSSPALTLQVLRPSHPCLTVEGTFGGGPPLDGPGTDFPIRYVDASWRYHKITAARLHDDLAGLPPELVHVAGGQQHVLISGQAPTAADLQIGATLRVLLTIGDVRPLIEIRGLDGIARRCFPAYPGEIPAGAFPAGCVPEAD